MFDPTIGRWMQEDPRRFEAGDANLEDYVENDPTNLTDPSGLQSQRPGAKLDPQGRQVDYSGLLANRTIPFGTCGAVISTVYQVWRLDDDKQKPSLPYLAFTVTLRGKPTDADKALLKKTYWLQIVKTDRYTDVSGKKETLANKGASTVLVFPKETSNRKEALETSVKYGAWALDAGLLTCPRVTDHLLARYERTETALTFWDSPNALVDVSKAHPLIVQHLEAYLIIEDKAAYVIRWTVNNKWNSGIPTRQFGVVDGEVTKKLPEFLFSPAAKLYRGDRGLGFGIFATSVNNLVNPVKGVVPPPK